MNVLLFGDQTTDQYPLLRKVITRRDNALLTTFLERTSVALRQEVNRLPRSMRNAIPDFLRIGDLVEAYRNCDRRIPQLESCMVTIAQLSHYIGYAALPVHAAAKLTLTPAISATIQTIVQVLPIRASWDYVPA